MNANDKILFDAIVLSLEELSKNEGDLIHHEVREETINKQLSGYLEKNIKSKIDIGDRKIDVEYDKNMGDNKKVFIDGIEEVVRPDIIVHKRRNNEKNFLIVEAKKFKDSNYDDLKIKAFLTEERYNYQYGAFVRYNVDNYYMELRFYYKDGDGQVQIEVKEIELV